MTIESSRSVLSIVVQRIIGSKHQLSLLVRNMTAGNFDKSVYVEAALAQQMFEGKAYALPISTNVFALYYNKDILEDAGITKPPTTLEEDNNMTYCCHVIDVKINKTRGRAVGKKKFSQNKEDEK